MKLVKKAENSDSFSTSAEYKVTALGEIPSVLPGECDDVAAGLLIKYQMSPDGQHEKESKEMLAQILTNGMSPNNIKSLLGYMNLEALECSSEVNTILFVIALGLSFIIGRLSTIKSKAKPKE